nr:L627 [uncultured bacterium]
MHEEKDQERDTDEDRDRADDSAAKRIHAEQIFRPMESELPFRVTTLDRQRLLTQLAERLIQGF